MLSFGKKCKIKEARESEMETAVLCVVQIPQCRWLTLVHTIPFLRSSCCNTKQGGGIEPEYFLINIDKETRIVLVKLTVI